MDKEFIIDDKKYILNIKDNNVRIFLADNKGNPSIELNLTLYDDLNDKAYVTYDIKKSFITSLDYFNNQYPIHSFSYTKKLIITKDYNIYLLKKNNGLFSVYKVSTKDFENNDTGNNYNQLLNELLLGKTINVGSYIMSSDSFYKFLTGEVSIDIIDDNDSKNIILSLINNYKRLFGNNISEGTGAENAKIKVRKAGFINKLFMISLSCFTAGIVVTLIFVIIKKYLF